MNIIRNIAAPAIFAVALAFTSCADKTTPVLIEQGERLNTELQTLASENPDLFGELSAAYTDNGLVVDINLKDSLFVLKSIDEPLFNFFTACEIKNHLDKNLETTVNALGEKEAPLIVKLTDAYGDSHSYEYTAADLRRMAKSPLTQLGFNEARDGLFAALAASEAQFVPAEGHVKGYSTSFKGGFYAYTVEFQNASFYRGLVTANLKARALKVFEQRYAKLGTLRPVLLGMYKALGIDGFHLIYSAGEGSPTLKTTVTLSNIQ